MTRKTLPKATTMSNKASTADSSKMDTSCSSVAACSSSTKDELEKGSNLVQTYLGDSDSDMSESEVQAMLLEGMRRSVALNRKAGSIMRADIKSATPPISHTNMPNFDPYKMLNELDVGPYDDSVGFTTIAEFEKYLVENHFDLAKRICELDKVPSGPSKRQQQRDRVERLKMMTAAVNRPLFEPKVKKNSK